MTRKTSLFDSVSIEIDNSVTIDILYLNATNLALAHNRIPVVHFIQCEVSSEAEDDFAFSGCEVVIQAEVEGKNLFDPITISVPPLSKNARPIQLDVTRVSQVETGKVAHYNESVDGSLKIRIDLRVDGQYDSKTAVGEFRILAADEWFNSALYYESLAAFIQPNSPEIERLLAETSKTLAEATGNSAIEGYQRGGDRAVQIAAAAYETMKNAGLFYSEPPASFENTGQKIRSSSRVFEFQTGTCIDLALAYSALVEQAGLNPGILLIQGHAMTGIFATEKSRSEPVIYNSLEIRNLILSGEFIPVDIVAATDKESTFASAVAKAQAIMEDAPGFGLVSVKDARRDGIRPLPLKKLASQELISVSETTSPPQGSSTGGKPNFSSIGQIKVKDLMPFRESENGEHQRIVADNTVPTRILNWKRELLDLSLNNRLLNLRPGPEVLPVMLRPGMLSELDDLIHAGTSLSLYALDEVSDNNKLRGIQSVKMLPDSFLMEALIDSKRVFIDQTERSYKTYLNRLIRTTRTLLEETGAANLYLGLGTFIYERNGDIKLAPLFLVPIRLKKAKGNAHFTFEVDSATEASPNYCLVEWLKNTHGLTIPALSEPKLDSSGLDINHAITEISRYLVEANLHYTVSESAHILITKFSTYGMWKDLENHWQEFESSPVFHHIAHNPGTSFIDPAVANNDITDIRDIKVAEETIALPIPADGAQLQAIIAAGEGRSFVLEGPPGTGKSQTITNLIAHCLEKGKTVLFVAEKQAALEVVKKRLKAVGLAPFTLDLHGKDQSPASIRQQLKETIDADIHYDEHRWNALMAKLADRLRPFISYPGVVHTPNGVDQSLWTATLTLAGLGQGPVAEVSPSYVKEPVCTAERLEDAFEQCIRLSKSLDPQLLSGYEFLGVNFLNTEESEFKSAWNTLADSYRDLCEYPSWQEVIETEDLQTAVDTICTIPLYDRLDLVQLSKVRFGIQELENLAHEASAISRQAAPFLKEFSLAFVTSGDINPIVEAAQGATSGIFGRGKRLRAYEAALRAALPDPTVPMLDLNGAYSPQRVMSLLPALVPLRQAAETLMRKVQESLWAKQFQTGTPFDSTLEHQLIDRTKKLQFQFECAESWPVLFGMDRDQLAQLPQKLENTENAWEQWCNLIDAPHEWARSSSGKEQLESFFESWNEVFSSKPFSQLRLAAQFQQAALVLKEAHCEKLIEQAVSGHFKPEDSQLAIARGLATASVHERLEHAGLESFDPAEKMLQLEKLQAAINDVQEEVKLALPARLLSKRPYKAGRLTGNVAQLRRLLDARRNARSFRSLLSEYPSEITTVAPCFLVSPASLATYVAPGAVQFDVVVFDEASQVTVDQAMGALGRGTSAVIVGDSKQMPPTRFGKAGPQSFDDLEDLENQPQSEELGPNVDDLESILTEAVESGLPRLSLTWHYRSHDESLIAFSNERYYEGKLASLPSPKMGGAQGVTFRRVSGQFCRERGKYLRTNLIEAEAIVAEVCRRLNDPATAEESLGIVTFNIQQRNLILDLLEDCKDPLVIRGLESGVESIFVKNLENVQGDERDTILFSVAFSKKEEGGALPLNFGPLSNNGGEKRLNVAITRARKSVVIFCSFDPTDIDLSRTNSKGTADLRGYLELASRNQDNKGLESSPRRSVHIETNHVRDDIAARLRERGWIVATDYGMSSFTLDLVIRPEGDSRWHGCVLLDGPRWAAMPTVSDRDLTPELLGPLMKWASTIRVWLPEWISDPESVISRIEKNLGDARSVIEKWDQNEREQKQLVAQRIADELHESARKKAEEDSIEDLDINFNSSIYELEEQLLPPANFDLGVATTTKERAIDPFGAGENADVHSKTPDLENPWEEGSQHIPTSVKYVPFELPALGERDELESPFNPQRKQELQNIIVQSVGQYGPISLDKLRIHILQAFGRQKGNKLVDAQAVSLVPEDMLVPEGSSRVPFVWPRGIDRHTWSSYRVPSGDRNATDVSIVELANAMRALPLFAELAEDSDDGLKEEIIRDTMKIFGFKRLSSKTKFHFQEVIDFLFDEPKNVGTVIETSTPENQVTEETKFVVLDLETTGFSRHDRVIEIAAVMLDSGGEIVDKWTTLVNPDRGISNSQIHGISSTDVALAPRFAEVADDLAALLNGKIIVAHNARFDTRMLAAEFERVGIEIVGLEEDFICTLKLAQDILDLPSRNLRACLEMVGIQNDRWHAALSDATATAKLFTHFWNERPTLSQLGSPVIVRSELKPRNTPKIAREGVKVSDENWIQEALREMPASEDPVTDEYMQLLDFVMLDFEISLLERQQLISAAQELGLSFADVHALHIQYLRKLVRVMLSDRILSEDEEANLRKAAQALHIEDHIVEELIYDPALIGDSAEAVSALRLEVGDRIAITGQTLLLPRSEWEQRARAAGLHVAGVAKATILAVAADVNSFSSKAKKAREYRIPIISEQHFKELLEVLESRLNSVTES